MQRLMTVPGPLLDKNGRLTETGYALSLIKEYSRGAVKASPLRIKEWDYYCVVSDRYALALTIADNGYLYMDSVSLMDFDDHSQATWSSIHAPFGGRKLPSSSVKGDIGVSGKGYALTFENDGKRRRLYGHVDSFPNGKGSPLLFDVTLAEAPRDSMVIATPFAGHPRAFYYNQKINCLAADGKAVYGDREYLFSPAHSFAVLDWGRGVWTYDNTWYWGSASGLAEGVPFGFNIGYGFGDTSAASENMLFYNGRAHKLSQVAFEIPVKDGREDYLAPWKFTSEHARFEMDFEPVLDRCANIDFKLLCSDQHQVFGRFTGRAVLDDGREIRIRRFPGFAEKVHNRW